jgi:ubiquinol-cytochrome c reductase cytochrome c1 subunit
MKKLLTALLVAPAIAFASGAALHLDKAPEVQGDNAALQSGARTFVNYCMNCHGLSFVRYNRLTELGLSEQQIKDHLLFTADKIGEPMRVAARPAEQKIWFGSDAARSVAGRPRACFRGR